MQLASLHSLERGEVLLDAFDKFGEAALRVVAPRIRNEQVVGMVPNSFEPMATPAKHSSSAFRLVTRLLHNKQDGRGRVFQIGHAAFKRSQRQSMPAGEMQQVGVGPLPMAMQ